MMRDAKWKTGENMRVKAGQRRVRVVGVRAARPEAPSIKARVVR